MTTCGEKRKTRGGKQERTHRKFTAFPACSESPELRNGGNLFAHNVLGPSRRGHGVESGDTVLAPLVRSHRNVTGHQGANDQSVRSRVDVYERDQSAEVGKDRRRAPSTVTAGARLTSLSRLTARVLHGLGVSNYARLNDTTFCICRSCRPR